MTTWVYQQCGPLQYKFKKFKAFKASYVNIYRQIKEWKWWKRVLGFKELAPLEHPVAPGVLEPVGCPLLPPSLLLGHGQGPALGGQPGPPARAHPSLLQAAEQRVGH